MELFSQTFRDEVIIDPIFFKEAGLNDFYCTSEGSMKSLSQRKKRNRITNYSQSQGKKRAAMKNKQRNYIRGQYTIKFGCKKISKLINTKTPGKVADTKKHSVHVEWTRNQGTTLT